MAQGSRLLADVRPLRESPAFRRLWAGVTLSAFGGSLTSFAVILEAGALASLTTPVISAVSGGLVTVAGALVIGVALPGFRRYRREAGESRGPGEVTDNSPLSATANP